MKEVTKMAEFKTFLRQAANVKPSARQLRMLDTGFYAFAHFGVNTFTDREWGDGKEDPGIFNPVDLDCDQWCEAFKSAGMKGLVLTAKHHDGFCLWPSKFTEHSVKNSPFKRDVVKEAAEACARAGLKFGVYLSPWDRNSKYYGSDEYNVYYRSQLTELLTGYGEMFHIWFDGACGEGPNGKRQIYDYESYIELIRRYQPNATIFNDGGPDIRWCGNEAGHARRSEWAVVPSELCFRSEIQTEPGPLCGDLSHMYNSDEDIGGLPNILYSKGLVFTPSEVDMSIRPGWFWHENEDPHPLSRLFDTYLNSVGGNTTFNLNCPPDRRGRIDDRDEKRLAELGALLRNEFSTDLCAGGAIKRLEWNSETQVKFEIPLDRPSDIKYIELAEDIVQGQRIELFRVEALNEAGAPVVGYSGTTVGSRRIIKMGAKGVAKLRLFVTAARGEVQLKTFRAF